MYIIAAVFMVFYIIGGSLGSYGWSVARWNGVCLVGVILIGLAIGVYVMGSLRKRRLKTEAKQQL